MCSMTWKSKHMHICIFQQKQCHWTFTWRMTVKNEKDVIVPDVATELHAIIAEPVDEMQCPDQKQVSNHPTTWQRSKPCLSWCIIFIELPWEMFNAFRQNKEWWKFGSTDSVTTHCSDMMYFEDWLFGWSFLFFGKLHLSAELRVNYRFVWSE